MMDVKREMELCHIPGLSICTFSNNQFATQNFGFAQAGGDQRISDNTIFHACSISKFITALCVLNLVAEKSLDLHLDVNNYLSTWKLTGSQIALSKPVTLAMLLSHCAGIADPPGSFEPYREGEAPVSNLDLLEGRTRFHPQKVQVTMPPENQLEYSDAGYCVIEQVVEDSTGHNVEFHAQKYIFNPLGLRSTFFWRKGGETGYPLERCAAGHDSKGRLLEGERVCYPNPEGAGLWSTTRELAAITSDFLACLQGKGQVLPQKQAELMMTPYRVGSWGGLGIFLSEDKARFSSQGWGEGMQCKLVGMPGGGRGIVVMMNCEPGVDQEHSIIGKIIQQSL